MGVIMFRVQRTSWSRILVLSVFLFALICNVSFAGSVGKGQAQHAVRGWLKHNKRPMGRVISEGVTDFKTMDDEGQRLCYIVNLEPGGFIIVSADTEIEPIIAFSSTGHYDGDEGSPLTALLKRDMKGRLKAIQQKAHRRSKAAKKEQKWDLLMNAGAELKSDELPSIQALALSVSEVWVDPFLLSEWNQGDVGGSPCYNYYTPGNYVAGCVATTMAQVMRYHTWPTSGIGVHGFTIKVDGVPETAYTQGGNGSGGAYNWAQMPFVPTSSMTTTQRQAIGALCYDAAVSAKMSFTSTSSGASLVNADQELTQTFDYSNSVYTRSFSSSGDDRLWNILNANLDAQLPVILGISRTSGGHAVIADGYGYTGDTLYHHINMGWGGSDNAWYQLPLIDASYVYTVVDDCIYNLYTTGTGEIVSGRVTNLAGGALAGVTVGAYNGTTLVRQTTTDSRGVYALTHLSSSTTYTIKAAKGGENFLDQTVSTGHSIDWSTPGNRSGILFVSAVTGPPTTYDMQVDVNAGDSALIHLQGLDDGVPDPNLFRCIITALPSHGILNEPNVGLIDWVPYELSSSIRDVNYLPCPYFGGTDAFTYKANDGGTYPTGGDSNIATVTMNVNDQLYTDYYSDSNIYTNGLLETSSYSVRNQVIYLTSELGPSKRITDLAIHVHTSPGRSLTNWTIRMQHTNLDSYSSLMQVYDSGWTVVFQSNESMAVGWNWFHFDTPFDYNGLQNLMIDFSFQNPSTASVGYHYRNSVGQTRNYMMFDVNGDAGSPLNWDYYSNWDSYNQSTSLPVLQLLSIVPVDPLLGDFDASCDVRMPDVGIFSQAWMTSSGEAHYNADCDLTVAKGAVDLQDLLILMGQWMETYPY